jgi:transcriptional regulator with XRE-family HTH domain
MKLVCYPALAALIAAQGWSHPELGAAVSVGATTINRVVSGRQRPSADLRARFADVLGVPEDVLFQLSPDVAQLIKLADTQGLNRLVPVAPQPNGCTS